MSEVDTWTHHRAKVANAVLRGDAAAADLARRDLRAARLADYIRDAVASAPEFTPEQRQRLAALLGPAVKSVTTQPKARARRKSTDAA